MGKRINYENLPFRKKLFFVFGISLVLCVVITVSMLTDYCSRILVQNTIADLNVINEQAGIDFNRRRSDTEKQLFNYITMFRIPDNIALCDAEKSDYRKRELKYSLNQVVAENTHFDYAYLMTDSGYVCDTIEKIGAGKEELLTFVSAALEENKESSLKNGYAWISDADNHIYLIHSIRQLSSLDHVGYVIVRIKDQAFALIEDTELGIGLAFYDRDKRCIHVETERAGLAENLYAEIQAGRIGEGDWWIAGEQYYAVEDVLGNTGWRVLGITPISSIEHMRRQIRIVAVLLATVALCCGGLLMNYLTRKVGRQIDAVSDAILEAARGDIGVQAPVYMDDDIGKIARHFNEMSLQNKRLIEDLVNAETQKNNARMEAVDYKYRFLHTQINPHFIYNSLELINAIAKVHHTPEVSRVVQLIGKYFRNITKYSDMQSITVAREFELLECCIEIYKMIRGSNIDIIMDCPEELRQVEIPTMLLQPIVENSFIHGMRGMDELFIVRLSAQCETGADGTQSCLVLTVADNGPGMDQEAVERLKAGGKGGEGQEHGGGRGAIHNIGIPNIIARLKMLYGDRAKLQIESGSEGTTTTIRLPLNEEGDGKDEERRAVV